MSEKNSQQVTYSAAQLREHVREGEGEDLHAHAGLAPDAEPRELLNFLATAYDPDHAELPARVEETALYQDVLRNTATDAVTEAVEEGNISQMQYNVGMVSHDTDASDSAFRTWLQSTLVSEASVFFVTGGMGAGKSDWAANCGDEWHMAVRGRVATNIESLSDRNPVPEYVSSYTEAEALMKESRDDFMLIIDETGQGLTGYGKEGQQARALAKLLKLVRKGDAPAGTKRCIVFIGQTVRDLSKDLRRLVAQTGAFFHKSSKKRLEVYGEELIEAEISNAQPSKVVKGIPKARWTFDTTEEPVFDMSGALDDGDDESAEDARKSEKERTAQRLRDQGMSGTDIAEVVGMSKTWVYDNTEKPGNRAESADD
ncbi:hypothetical protein [Halorarius halobius]|uniref:hypothetical protein n=1 Tax=Halorarius halobius TaxID=2962671 RepID=UPI0020CEA29B|nr:hypothetical protein [Halorarius halobius]